MYFVVEWILPKLREDLEALKKTCGHLRAYRFNFLPMISLTFGMFWNFPHVQQAMVNQCVAPRSRNTFATNPSSFYMLLFKISRNLALFNSVFVRILFSIKLVCLLIVLWQLFCILHFCSESILGEIASLYDELCELEIKQGKTNPGVKSVYSLVSQKIRDCATRFSNQQANCRTHFKKQPAKGKSAAKSKAKPVQTGNGKEEDDVE